MKEQELKSLTWKYFWEQKIKELAWTLLVLAILGIYYVIIDYTNCKFPTFFGSAEEFTCHSVYENIGYMCLFSLVLMVIGVILFFIGHVIYAIIKSNWKKAKKRAEKELEK